MTHVDGNAAAGALALAFGREMTSTTMVCAECGDQHQIGSTRVYLRCPGIVISCPNCTAVEIVLNNRQGRIDLYLKSVATLQMS